MACGAARRPARRLPALPPRVRACLVVPGRRRRPARTPLRSPVERMLVGLATVLCSALVVVVLGLLAEASAGGSGGPAAPAGPVASYEVSSPGSGSAIR